MLGLYAMQMILPFVALIFYALSSVSAYGTYGAYERIFYYYAHLTDAKAADGVARRVASGCPSTDGPCPFNKFIKFIENREEMPNLPNVPVPNIHAAAKELDRKGHNRVYSSSRVFHDTSNVATLVERVSRYMISIREAELDQTWDPARASIEVVCFLRKVGNSDKLKQFLLSRGIDPIMKVQCFQCEQRWLVDKKETIKYYETPDLPVGPLFKEFEEAEESHESIVQAACSAAIRLYFNWPPLSSTGAVFQSSDKDEGCREKGTFLKDGKKDGPEKLHDCTHPFMRKEL